MAETPINREGCRGSIVQFLQRVGYNIFHDAPEISLEERFLLAREKFVELGQKLLKYYPQISQLKDEKSTDLPKIGTDMTHPFQILAFMLPNLEVEDQTDVANLRDKSGKLLARVQTWFTEETIDHSFREVETSTSNVAIIFTLETQVHPDLTETRTRRVVNILPGNVSSALPQEMYLILGDTGGYSVLYKNYDESVVGIAVPRNGHAHMILSDDLQTELRFLQIN